MISFDIVARNANRIPYTSVHSEKQNDEIFPRATHVENGFLREVKGLCLRSLKWLDSIPGKIASLFRGNGFSSRSTVAESTQPMLPDSLASTGVSNPLLIVSTPVKPIISVANIISDDLVPAVPSLITLESQNSISNKPQRHYEFPIYEYDFEAKKSKEQPRSESPGDVTNLSGSVEAVILCQDEIRAKNPTEEKVAVVQDFFDFGDPAYESGEKTLVLLNGTPFPIGYK